MSAGKGEALVIGFGKKPPSMMKGEPDEGSPDEENKDETDIEKQLGAAFDAQSDGDRDGYVASLRAAFKAMCAEYME